MQTKLMFISHYCIGRFDLAPVQSRYSIAILAIGKHIGSDNETHLNLDWSGIPNGLNNPFRIHTCIYWSGYVCYYSINITNISTSICMNHGSFDQLYLHSCIFKYTYMIFFDENYKYFFSVSSYHFSPTVKDTHMHLLKWIYLLLFDKYYK